MLLQDEIEKSVFSDVLRRSVQLTGVLVIMSVVPAGCEFVGASVRTIRSEAQTCVLIRRWRCGAYLSSQVFVFVRKRAEKERNVIVFPTAAGCFSAPAVQASFTAL